LREKPPVVKKKTVKVGAIHPGKVKVRKKNPLPSQVQKSPRDYDRKRLKQKIRKELGKR